MFQENWPSYKIWAKEKGLKLAKTKHESETLFRKRMLGFEML